MLAALAVCWSSLTVAHFEDGALDCRWLMVVVCMSRSKTGSSQDNFQAFRSGTDGDNLQGGSDWGGAAQVSTTKTLH